jgi:AraC family transcriptional regulator
MTIQTHIEAGPAHGMTLAACGLLTDEPAAKASDTREQFTAILVRLLDNARLALNTNRRVAETCIARVSSMLLAEEDRRTSPAADTPEKAARGGLAPWQLRRVIAHVDASLTATLRVRDLNEITGLSASHFSRAFKASVGLSVHAYIIRRRMERAQELMLVTNDSLCQIALQCGLCDQAHFSRLFRRVVGTSPNVWRRQWTRYGATTASNLPRGRPSKASDEWRPRRDSNPRPQD